MPTNRAATTVTTHSDGQMALPIHDFNPLLRALLLGLAGVCVGNVLCRWMVRLTEPLELGNQPLPVPEPNSNSAWWHRVPLLGTLAGSKSGKYRSQPMGLWWPLVELGSGLLFVAFSYAYLNLRCQATVEVRPGDYWHVGRLFYHLVLISLLITATGTDFRDFTISDWITVPGMLIGVVMATASGELQMMHIWSDWNDLLAELNGPYLPQWMKDHHHLHGLAWSLCGLAGGGGMTWLVRGISKFILGHEAMGFGDVTLMAMIGSFIGWQPVLFVFLFAPLCGLAMSISIRLFTGRTFLPYGPYLSAAAVIVLFSWRWIWMLELPISADRKFSVRHLMGDWQQLAWLAGISLGGLTVLLGLVRAFRAMPIGSEKKQ